MSSQPVWFETPDVLLEEIRRHDLVFRRTLDIPGFDDVQEFARGGQGSIYIARQRSTQRRVAIKLLYEDARSLAARRLRFEREIELVSKLEHPNIVRIYDSGVTHDGRLYIVMEYIDGTPLIRPSDSVSGERDAPSGSLPQLARAAGTPAGPPARVQSWPLRKRLELFATICDAVHFAHQRGVLHRDLKPGNIVVDASGKPHVLDFGVARSLQGPHERGVTHTGQFLGTLAYAAPEQVSGSSDGTDVRTDVYALGVILYELLSGQHPYSIAGTFADSVRIIAESRPPAPGRRFPGCGSDADLDAVVLQALAKEKARRYQSAEALAADLRRALAGEPVEARRGSRWYVFRKTVSRHRWALAVVASFAVLLGGWGATMAVLRDRAAVERDRAQAEAAKYRRIVEFFDDTFYTLKDPTAGQVTLRELLDESRNWLYVLEDAPEVQAAVRTSVGNWYRGVGAYADAAELLEGGLATHRDVFGDESLEVARSLGSLGLLRRDQGELAEAERLMRDALAIRRDLLGDIHVDVAYSLGNLALLRRDMSALAEAEQLLREQLRIRRSLAGGEDASVALTMHNLAGVIRAAGEIDQAETLYRETLALRERLLSPGHPDLAASCAVLAELLVEAGRPEEARRQLTACEANSASPSGN